MQNFCSRCGEKLSPDSRFCPQCGQNLHNSRYQFHVEIPRPTVPQYEYLPFSCILGYIPFLFWIPLVCKNDSRIHRESANQGLWITLLTALAYIIYGVGAYLIWADGFHVWNTLITAFEGWTPYNWMTKLPWALGCAAAAQLILIPMIYTICGIFHGLSHKEPWRVPLVGRVNLIQTK